MLKRLIEVALPLKEVSEESAHDNRVRSGHIRTLHVWWARRPLVACRAVVFASLIPDPDDPNCPKAFSKLVSETLKRNEFTPRNGDGSTVADTPRGRCLELLKHLVKWENSNNPEYIEPARTLVAAAFKLLHPDAPGETPATLDPFAGGGAMPLEALRLGCRSHAVDLNPVAHLIELCALVYPQRYGRPNSIPVPSYISRLAAQTHSAKRLKGERHLFGADSGSTNDNGGELPEIDISEEHYKLNPLRSDVMYWGNWVLMRARRQLQHFYPVREKHTALAYLWARTVKCPNPACGATVPCIHQLWLCNKAKKKIALKLDLHRNTRSFSFTIVQEGGIDFDPNVGTMQRGQAACPFCQSVLNSKYLQVEGNSGRIDQRLIAVVESTSNDRTKTYRLPVEADYEAFSKSQAALAALVSASPGNNVPPVPTEPLKAWSGVFNAPLFGMTTWGSLLNPRQAHSMTVFVQLVKEAQKAIAEHSDAEYAVAITTYLAFALDKCLDFSSTLCRWGNDDEGVTGTFGRQALPMVWDYAESNPLQDRTGGFSWALGFVTDALTEVALSSADGATVVQGSATALPYGDGSFHCIATDPPYYDAVPYSDLSDYFYVWLKRTVGDLYPHLFRTPLTPKAQEVVSHLGNNYPGKRKSSHDYEAGMESAFAEMRRVVGNDGICVVMFAHKTTTAWETLIAGTIRVFRGSILSRTGNPMPAQ